MEPRTVLLILAVINGACSEDSTEDISNNTLSSFPPALNENISSTSGSLVSDEILKNITATISLDTTATTTPSNVVTTANESSTSSAITTDILDQNSNSTALTKSSVLIVINNLTSNVLLNLTTHELNITSSSEPEEYQTTEQLPENEFGNDLMSEFLMENNDSDSSGDGNPNNTPIDGIGHIFKINTEVTDNENLTSELPISSSHLPIIDDELLTNENTNNSMEAREDLPTDDPAIITIQHAKLPTVKINEGEIVLSPEHGNTSEISRVLEKPASIFFSLSTPISDLESDNDEESILGSSSTKDYFKVERESGGTVVHDGKVAVENETTTERNVSSIDFETNTKINSERILTYDDSPTDIGSHDISNDLSTSQQTAYWFASTTNPETAKTVEESLETSTSKITTMQMETRNGKMVPFPTDATQLLTTPTTDGAVLATTLIKDNSSEEIDQIVETNQIRFVTETVTPSVVIDNLNDPIKHHEDLKDNEYTNAVTVIFTVPQPIQMDVFWDEERNRKFRNFVINAINLEEEKGWPHLALEEDAIYEKYDTEWVRKKREIKHKLKAEDLIYIAPSPMAENRNIYVAFFVRNGSTTDPDDVVYGMKIFYAVNSTRIGLEQEMGLNITRITPGIILVRYMDSIFVRYAIVFIALLAVAVFCICVIIFGLIYMKCKNSRGKWDTSEYGEKSNLKMDIRINREIGHLHSDHDIQQDEDQLAKNGHKRNKHVIQLLRDEDGWVKPLDENAGISTRPKRTEDTKL